jgi:proteic killer suppression protein
MIKSFNHKGLQAYFFRGTKAGIRPDHAPKLTRLLARLNVAVNAADMNLPGWGLHALTGELKGHWTVSVNGNWRMTFTFDGTDAVLVDYMDYH